MGRKILAVLAGVIVAGMLVFLGEIVGSKMFPPPPGMDPLNAESIREHLALLPTGAFVVVLISWAFGSFVGGFAATGLAKGDWRMAIGVGVIQMILGDMNFFYFTHPTWMIVLSPACFIPMALLGAKLARR